MTDLSGSLAVVTGGRKGLGLALAKELGRRGTKVVIASISDAAASVAELRSHGVDADWFRVDVSDPEQVEAFAASVHDTHGTPNIVINNAAGGAAQGSLQESAVDDIRRAIEVNILGYVWVVRAFADDLVASARAGKPAYLVNVGSEHSLGVPPHVQPLSAYTITKQADLAITETTRRDLAGTGVQVSLLAPGWILTENVEEFMTASDDFRSAVEPYAQSSDEVARRALDGLFEGRDIIVTNPKSVPFARARAESILRDLHRAEYADAPHPHDGTGDISQCPVVGGH